MNVLAIDEGAGRMESASEHDLEEPDWFDDGWGDLPPEAFEGNLGLSPEDYSALFPSPAVKRAEDEAATAAYRAGTLDADDGMPELGPAVAAASGDLAGKSDAGVVGVIRACAELIAMAKSRMYESLGEFAERRPGRAWDRRAEEAELEREGPDGPSEVAGPGVASLPRVPSREMTQEVMLEMNWTEYRAAGEAHRAVDLLRRLPRTHALLREGRTDDEHVKLVCDFTVGLSDAKARMVDERVAPWMEDRTTGQLKDKLRRELIRIDPAAAEERRKRGEKQARVSAYPNPDGTGTFAVERAPADEVAAAKARVNAIARAAKSAGSADPMGLLEAETAMGLLLGTLPYIPPPNADGGDNGDDPGDPGPDHGPGPEDKPEEAAAGAGWRKWPTIPPGADAAGPGCAVLPPGLRPANPGRIRLLSPWRTLAGVSGEPGELSWFGVITPGQGLEIAAAAAADPHCRWQVIVTDDTGRALAVETVRRRRPGRGKHGQPRAPGMVEEVTLTIPASLARRRARDPDLCPWLARNVRCDSLAEFSGRDEFGSVGASNQQRGEQP